MPASLPSPESQPPAGVFLFSDEQMQAITNEEEKYGRYTADRMPLQKREACILLLSEDRDISAVSRIVGVSRDSVVAVLNHPEYGRQILEIVERAGTMSMQLARK